MFIVIEGLDGAGKSTQVKMLKQYLSERCKSLNYIHFPRYDSPVYGSLIARFLQGKFGSIETVHPQLVALLFAEDRHNAAPLIRQSLEQGGTVLIDRYVYSNIAYQCAKLSSEAEAEELRKWIISTEYGVFQLPRPDINIFLDVPLGFVEHSLNNERAGDDRAYLNGSQDIHEADLGFQKRVRDMYRKQASIDEHFIVVNCSDEYGEMLPAKTIFEKLKAIIYEIVEKN